MSEGPNTTKIGLRRVARTAIPIFVLCLISLGTWGYRTRWHVAPPPGTLPIRTPAAKVVSRFDSAASKTQDVLPSSPAQKSEGAFGATLGSDYQANFACFEHPKTQVDHKLVAELGPDHPALSRILTVEYPSLDPKIVRQLLDNLLEATKSASPEKKPALLLAADEIAERLALPPIAPASPELQRQLNELAAEGVTFKWAELDGGWLYGHNLLWRIWREYPASEEGEEALVLLLRQGWDKSPCCNTGGRHADAFYKVIEHGEEFLSDRPKSGHRQEVLFLVAQAYETWWSLSLVPEQDREEGDPSPAAYREGAAAAREKAIAFYGEIVGMVPDSLEASCSRKPLELLKENEDTHQRRFYCYCD